MRNHIQILALLLPIVATSGGWSLFGEEDTPPTAEDIKEKLELSRVERLTCIRAEDARGGYLCHFISENTGIFGGGARFVKEGGAWQVFRN